MREATTTQVSILELTPVGVYLPVFTSSLCFPLLSSPLREKLIVMCHRNYRMEIRESCLSAATVCFCTLLRQQQESMHHCDTLSPKSTL